MGRVGRTASARAGWLLLIPLSVACGGRTPPETMDPEPVREEAPPPDDSAEREAEAARLCDRALAALDAGNYDTARELLRQVQRDYPGTECARASESELERVDAIAAIRERVHFEFDRSRITDEANRVLQRKAQVLQRHPDVRITIEGHCDERGSLEYNQALGMRRAESTRRHLVGLGLSADRFRTVSYGEERPLVNESNESAWAMNRRADFTVTEWGSLGESAWRASRGGP